MYCEQMMLEQGFEDTPARRVIVATDAIWRAARIVLDIRLHRGEIGVDEAVDFLVEHTRFERAGGQGRGAPLHADARLQPLLPAGQGAPAALARR